MLKRPMGPIHLKTKHEGQGIDRLDFEATICLRDRTEEGIEGSERFI